MTSDTQTAPLTGVPLVVSTISQKPLARLLMRNDLGQVVQQWLVKQNKCTLGSAAGCSLRCAEPGIAPYHALLVVGARQTFVRALAPKLTRDGLQVNEILLTDESGSFEIAGHHFELTRGAQTGEQPQSSQASNSRLKFTLARPFELNHRAHSAAETPSETKPETDSGNPAWVAKLVQSAIEPLECQLHNVLGPIAELQAESRRQRKLRRKKRAEKRKQAAEMEELGFAETQGASQAHVEQTVATAEFQLQLESIVTRQAAALDTLAERISDVGNQLAVIENISSQDRDSEQENTEVQEQVETQTVAIEQLQSGIVAVSNAIQTLQERQQLALEENSHWKTDVQAQLGSIAESLKEADRRAEQFTGSPVILEALERLQTSQTKSQQEIDAWKEEIQEQVRAIHASIDQANAENATEENDNLLADQLDLLKSRQEESLQEAATLKAEMLAQLAQLQAALEDAQTASIQKAAVEDHGHTDQVENRHVENDHVETDDIENHHVENHSAENHNVESDDTENHHVDSCVDESQEAVDVNFAEKPHEQVDPVHEISDHENSILENSVNENPVDDNETWETPVQESLAWDAPASLDSSEEGVATNEDTFEGCEHTPEAQIDVEGIIENAEVDEIQDEIHDQIQDTAEEDQGIAAESPATIADFADGILVEHHDVGNVNAEATAEETYELTEDEIVEEQVTAIADELSNIALDDQTEEDALHSDASPAAEDQGWPTLDSQSSLMDDEATSEVIADFVPATPQDADLHGEVIDGDTEHDVMSAETIYERVEAPHAEDHDTENHEANNDLNPIAFQDESNAVSDLEVSNLPEQTLESNEDEFETEFVFDGPSFDGPASFDDSSADTDSNASTRSGVDQFFEGSWDLLDADVDESEIPAAEVESTDVANSNDVSAEVNATDLEAGQDSDDVAGALPSWWTEAEKAKHAESLDAGKDAGDESVSETLNDDPSEVPANETDSISEPTNTLDNEQEEFFGLTSSLLESPADESAPELEAAPDLVLQASVVAEKDYEEEPEFFGLSEPQPAAELEADTLPSTDDEISEATSGMLDSIVDVTQASEASAGAEDEDSVEDYMRKLLARMRGVPEDEVEMPSAKKAVAPVPPTVKSAPQPVNPKPMDAEANTKATPVTPATDTPATVGATDEVTAQFDPEKYVPRALTPEANKNFSAMRELANSSARTAINTSNRQRHVTSVLLKLSIAGIGFFVAVVLLAINGLAVNIGLVATFASIVVAVIWGYDGLSSLKPLLQSELVLNPISDSKENSDSKEVSDPKEISDSKENKTDKESSSDS